MALYNRLTIGRIIFFPIIPIYRTNTIFSLITMIIITYGNLYRKTTYKTIWEAIVLLIYTFT